MDAIRLDGSEEQKAHYFEEVLKGKRFGNAFSEAGTKDVMDFQTKIAPDGNDFIVNGKKFYSTGARAFFESNIWPVSVSSRPDFTASERNLRRVKTFSRCSL